jgi:serine/threonine protein kinase
MRGGKLRGQGTYGCVFQPALLCRSSKNPSSDPTKVGKITGQEDAKNELYFGEYLNTIPDSNHYTIAADTDSCTPRAKSKQVDKDIDSCKFSEDIQLENTIQLSMPWGGYPLSRINLDPHKFDFFKFTEEILAIGAFLVLNDICHFDIWGQNFLFNSKNQPKLIDFGFAFRPSTLKVTDLNLRWRIIAFDHDTESPEVTLMLSSHQKHSVSEAAKMLQTEKPAVQRLVSLCGVSSEKWKSELLMWSQESQSFQKRDWTSCWKVYWPGFDAWSIGAVLLNIFEIQMGIPAFVNSDEYKTKGALLKKMLVGITRAHPVYRLDAAEALNVFTAGAHPLIAAGSAGSEWVHDKAARRPA